MTKQNFQDIEDSLKKLGVSTRLLFQEEKYTFQKVWRKTFANGLEGKELDWHTFSYNMIPHIKGSEAINAFNSQPVKNYLIISSNHKLAGLTCNGSSIISYEDLIKITRKNPFLYDLYISHQNLKWTFVITHEDEFGPYFSTLK